MGDKKPVADSICAGVGLCAGGTFAVNSAMFGKGAHPPPRVTTAPTKIRQLRLKGVTLFKVYSTQYVGFRVRATGRAYTLRTIFAFRGTTRASCHHPAGGVTAWNAVSSRTISGEPGPAAGPWNLTQIYGVATVCHRKIFGSRSRARSPMNPVGSNSTL